jgi:hypothetical protein
LPEVDQERTVEYCQQNQKQDPDADRYFPPASRSLATAPGRVENRKWSTALRAPGHYRIVFRFIHFRRSVRRNSRFVW